MNELVRWDPFKAVAPFEDSFFAIPSLFRPFGRALSTGPRLDVSENDTSYRLAIELAGVKKEAIQVSVQENTVTINAELADEAQNGEDVQWLLRERAVGKFSRSISLPEAVDDEASEARFTDGVLYLTLKKKSVSQTKRLTIH
ncbi:MAG: Hsp20/alpha crystallin family protein [Betaproteobacteria bacterium]|jgi:HSP20 family protein|nr:Hsp20/alpha crystallin family protein [Burkholderia sp.]MBW8905952.1 Hsp20/alpha crystallin family protein [Betaproteobacteria bacterium]